MKSHAWMWRQLKNRHRDVMEECQALVLQADGNTPQELGVAFLRAKGRWLASQMLQSIITSIEEEAREGEDEEEDNG